MNLSRTAADRPPLLFQGDIKLDHVTSSECEDRNAKARLPTAIASATTITSALIIRIS